MQPYDEMVNFAKDWKEWWGGLVNVVVKSCSNCGVAWFHSDDERIRSLQTWQDFGDDDVYCHKCTEAVGRILWKLAKLASDAVVEELTPLEERCICICLAVVSVFSIGSSVTYRGHVSTMRSDVQSFVDTLPRDPRSVGLVVVKRKTRGAMGGAARPAFKVNVPRMLRALHRLKELQDPDVPFSYADINIGNFDLYDAVDEQGDATPTFRQVEIVVEADENMEINKQLWNAWTTSSLPLAAKLIGKLNSTSNMPSWDLIRRHLSELAACRTDMEDADECLLMSNCSSRAAFPVKWLLYLFDPEDATNADLEKDGCDVEIIFDEVSPVLIELCQELECTKVALQPADLESADHTFGQDDVADEGKDEKEDLVDQILNHVGEEPPTNEPGPASDDMQADASDDRKCERPKSQVAAGQTHLGWAKTLRLDPPEAVEVVNESTEGYIRAAFPTVFPHGKCCPTERDQRIPFEDYCLHLQMSNAQAQSHHAFRYFVHNCTVRRQAFQNRTTWLLKTGDITAGEDLGRIQKKDLMGRVFKATETIPGTVGARRDVRRKLEGMCYQIEAESEQIPAVFTTTSSAIYKNQLQLKWICDWRRAVGSPVGAGFKDENDLHKLALSCPLVVAFFQAVRLELIQRFQAHVTQHSMACIQAPGSADSVAIFEWGSSGILHTHGFQWDARHVRTDKIFEDADSDMSQGEMEDRRDESYQDLIDYGASCVTEFHPGTKHAIDMDRVGLQLDEHPCAMPVEKYMDLLDGSAEDLIHTIEDLIESVEMHDNHLPHPAGPPMRWQKCAKVEPHTAGTDHEVVFCGKEFPKPEVKKYEEHLKNDSRRDILKYFGQRNNQFVNSFRPIHLLIALANVDDQIMTSMEALIQYATKYASKEKDDATGLEVFEEALAAAREQHKGLRSAMLKFFNRIVACNAFISANEVAHHALGLPSFVCSREFTSASLDPRARIINERALETGVGQIMAKSKYEIYCERSTHLPGNNTVHPVTLRLYEESEFMQYLQQTSFYHYLLWFTSRLVKGERKTSFVNGKPKIVLLSWVPLDRFGDDKKYKHNLRITLRSYLVLEEHGLSDAILASYDTPQLEDMMRKYSRDMPVNISKQFQKAQARHKRKRKRQDPQENQQARGPHMRRSREVRHQLADAVGQADDNEDDDDSMKKISASKFTKDVLKKALEHVCITTATWTKMQLLRAGVQYCSWLRRQHHPVHPTTNQLKAVCKQLRLPLTGKKHQLVQRVCNIFSDQPQQELQSDAGSLAKRSKVDKCIQEAQSRGKNAFEDGWDEAYHDGIEDHVLAERQSVRSSCDPSRFHREDEGFTPDFEVEDLKTMLARSVEKKSMRRKCRAASDKKPLDPTQSALPLFLRHWERQPGHTFYMLLV